VTGAGGDGTPETGIGRDAALREAVLAHVNARTVVAVSGGPDSFALLAAVHRWAPAHLAAAATFDHGTGAHATAACARVVAWCAARGIAVETGRADAPLPRTEAAWREARWRFLRDVAARLGARVATAHTRDDQAETVCIRILRDAGVRGLAGLAAPGPIARPFLTLPRATVHAWAAAAGLHALHDPANDDPAFLRNRVRHALLPALERAAPGTTDWLVALGDRAAAWRRDLRTFVAARGPLARRGAAMHVPDAWFADAGGPFAGHLWAEALSAAGVVLDRRGTERMIPFTTDGRPGGEVPLPGGVRVRRVRDGFVVARVAPDGDGATGPTPVVTARLVPPRLAWGQFCFQYGAGAPGSWSARLPRDAPLTVRAWRPGDRIAGAWGTRRVVRFFQEQGIPAAQRRAWPVIAIGEQIVWVPGVVRSDAATAGVDGPGDEWRCERREYG
jgi:tRNA(Ile)-lysidine synthase